MSIHSIVPYHKQDTAEGSLLRCCSCINSFLATNGKERFLANLKLCPIKVCPASGAAIEAVSGFDHWGAVVTHGWKPDTYSEEMAEYKDKRYKVEASKTYSL